MSKKSVIGILLAGGQSKRFGTPKMFAPLKDRPFYEYVYETMSPYVDDIVIVTRKELMNQFPRTMTTITDAQPFVGMGPLAGIYSAMTYRQAKKYVVLPCDMPLLNGKIVEELLRACRESLTVVAVEERLQPLVSLWSYSLKVKIYESLMSGNRRMKDFINMVYYETIDATSLIDEKELYRFINVNTSKDYEELKKWIKL